MPEILNDLSEQALTEAIENNIYAFTPLDHNWPQAEVYVGENVSWCLTDVAFPTCNSIIHVNLSPKEVDELLENLIAKARIRKVNLHCWVSQDTKPANLADYLTAHSFTSMGEAANLSIHTAEVLDHELEQLSPELISAIKALGDRHALDRSVHRKIHLDEIETALKARRSNKS